MRAGVIQSNYVPWRGYFDFIASVDLFVFYDDVAFSKGTYRNRNQLKFCDGLRWMTVPVHAKLTTPIDEVTIDVSRGDWRTAHERLLHESLEAAPHFADALDLWRNAVTAGDTHLSLLNVRLTSACCEYLGIQTRCVTSRVYGATGRSTERLLDLLGKLGAEAYLSGPSGRGYLDEGLFRRRGIRLEYKAYDYAPYPQLHGPFVGTVSVLDLIANCGVESSRHIRSRVSDEIAVP